MIISIEGLAWFAVFVLGAGVTLDAIVWLAMSVKSELLEVLGLKPV